MYLNLSIKIQLSDIYLAFFPLSFFLVSCYNYRLFCQATNEVLKVVGDSWMIYSTACRQDGGQHRASLIWHTRGRSICNIHIHACSLTHTHTQSLRVRWPGRSPRLRAITGQKQGDDRHWAFDNVSICCVCHSDSRSMLLRAWEKHAVQAMQSYTPLMSWQKRELGRQNVMQIGLRSGKIWSLKMILDYDTILKYPNLSK